MLTAILVDDMPQAIDVLRNDLAEHCPEVQIVGTANSIISAAKLLRQQMPDLLFLDILLGDGTGFDLLEIFPDLSAKVIFVTASDEYAIRAFRFAAIDYLLKPVNPDELRKAIQRASSQLANPRESIDLLKETIRHPNILPRRLSLHTQERILVVDIDQIIRCEAAVNNTQFFIAPNQRVFVTRTLKQFERLLEEHAFMRVHQSHLVNINHIREYVRKDGGYLKMKNGDSIPVATRKKTAVISMLDNL